MDNNTLFFLAQAAGLLALGLAAIGSGLGIGNAGMAAAGAWAREGRENRNLTFTYIILLGMPLSQTLYGFIALNMMGEAMLNLKDGDGGVLDPQRVGLLAGIGIACGLAQLFSAWMQGKIGAAGIRALVENGGKGFAFIIIAMGVAETVGIFGMVFVLGMIP